MIAQLDAALLNDKEWAAWQRVMRKKKTSTEEKIAELEAMFEDGFEDWLDGEDHEGHDHE